ncbi:hypothetical protein TMatcc_003134 [Talaromyces marneffei ATCC 18224]|uniref:uncharacterized protein n=1 Tax=Talaromyces marneffei TaxID=37727 RepID=UPI0012A7CF1A|nr:uncharacterized protein EYB26_001815 [Talaromyces marneffei]QGA14162.1 hypothetical protein EYB26_001815 [Talaromyces marneffei]
MARFTAYDSELQTIMNYPNVRGALELREPQSDDNKSKAPKRDRVASPELEDASFPASPHKKQKTEAEDTDAITLEQDSYSFWDAMLWGSSCPGITESFASSPKSVAQVVPEVAKNVFDGEFPVLQQQSIPESWNFTIWEDEDAGTDDCSLVGRPVHWVPEYSDENKENEYPEFDVVMEDPNSASESQENQYPEEQSQLRRIILGELQQN